MRADPDAGIGGLQVWYPRVTSTMDVAMALAASGAPHGTLVESAEQTAGRGRHGRHWVAPAGSAFLGSWLLRVPAGVDQAGLSPAIAAAVLRAVEAIAPGAPVQFKWPNDVLVDGRKIAGILLIARATQAGATVIAGTGVNVARESVPPGIEATCLTEWSPNATVSVVRHRLTRELGAVWDAVLAAGGLPEPDRELLEARMMWRDEPVQVVLPDGAITGIPAGLAADGALRLRSVDGVTERVLHVGEVARGPRATAQAGFESTVYLPEHDGG